MSEIVAVFGAHLQLGGHQPPATSGEQALSDHGPYLEENHEWSKEGPQSQFMPYAKHNNQIKLYTTVWSKL